MEDEDFKIVNLYNRPHKVFRDGRVCYFRYNKWNEYKLTGHNDGYKQIKIRNKGTQKTYLHHRIIGYAFLGLDIDNVYTCIDHIDRNRKNNNWLNLRIVTKQQNTFNRNAKGYWKNRNGYEAKICFEGKRIYLGYYKKEEDARQAYLDAKKIYHKY